MSCSWSGQSGIAGRAICLRIDILDGRRLQRFAASGQLNRQRQKLKSMIPDGFMRLDLLKARHSWDLSGSIGRLSSEGTNRCRAR
jgi:hypothetical protein